MGKFKNMDKVQHFVMEVKEVKKKVEKKEKQLDMDTIFDKSGDKTVMVAKKIKKKNKQNMVAMGYYNNRQKSYTDDMK
tara:strand:- start:1640 stop:1873 length:234 start_codon:yes stop_codon:yes gene_type:complete